MTRRHSSPTRMGRGAGPLGLRKYTRRDASNQRAYSGSVPLRAPSMRPPMARMSRFTVERRRVPSMCHD